MTRKYTDEELLAMLRKCERIHEDVTTETFDADSSFVASSTITRRVGSWTATKDKAGIDPSHIGPHRTGQHKQYTNKDIKSHLQALHDRKGKCTAGALAEHADLVSASVVINRFGGWLAAKRAAGVEGDRRQLNGRPRQFTDEEMLSMLRECQEKHGGCTQKQFDSDDEFCSPGGIRKRFGSWNTAKTLAGLDPCSRRRYTDEELFEQLVTCRKRHGAVTQDLLSSNEETASPATFRRRFGSIRAAKEHARNRTRTD